MDGLALSLLVILAALAAWLAYLPQEFRVTFDGSTFNEEEDGARLRRQLRDVFRLMSDGKARTLTEIATETGHPEASISARLRDLRKQKFGGHTVHRGYIGMGVWLYSLVINEEPRA